MSDRSRRLIVSALSFYIAFVFFQSLFFKFTDSPETHYIFGTLDTWAAGLGFPGLFAPNGLFSQYAVGSAELVTSMLLLAGLATDGGGARCLGSGSNRPGARPSSADRTPLVP